MEAKPWMCCSVAVDALGRLATPADSTVGQSAKGADSLDRLLAQISAVKLGQVLPSFPAAEPAAAPSKYAIAAVPPREPAKERETEFSRRIDATLDEFVLEAKEHLAGSGERSVGTGKKTKINRHRGESTAYSAPCIPSKEARDFSDAASSNRWPMPWKKSWRELRRHEAAAIDSSLIDALLAGADRTLALLDDVQRSNEADVAEIIQRLKSISAMDAAVPLPRAKSQSPAAATVSASEAASPAIDRAVSLRVPVPLVDRLMTLAGELVLARNQALRSIGGGAEAMRPVLQKLDAVTSELQGAVTQDPHATGGKSVRQVPARGPRSGPADEQTDRIGNDRNGSRVG